MERNAREVNSRTAEAEILNKGLEWEGERIFQEQKHRETENRSDMLKENERCRSDS